MREYAVVETIIQQLLPKLERHNIHNVSEVHFRRSSAFCEDKLRNAYQKAIAGTMLEGAVLIVDTINREYECACGYRQIVNCGDLHEELFVCPNCGAEHKVSDICDLQLVALTADIPPVA